MASLRLTNWGEFVHCYSTRVPPRFWQNTRAEIAHLMDLDEDWKFYTGEIVAGLQALMDDDGKFSLYKFIQKE